MPALPLPVTPVLRCKVVHKVGSDVNVMSGFFLGFTGPNPTAAELSTFASTLLTKWATEFLTYMSPQVSTTNSIVQDISIATGAEGLAAATNTGSRSGGFLPAGTCLNLNFGIARRYRGGKPRVYLPFGVDTDLATPQTWLSGILTTVASAWNALISALIASPPTGLTITGQVNVSFYEGSTWYQHPVTQAWHQVPTPRPGGALVDPIESVVGMARLGSQRRRN